MPLTVAMALSGLEPDHWNGELKQMYDQGASVVGKTYPNSPSVSSETSETTSYYSTESGISSMSPQSSVPLSPKDVHNIYLELMAKLEELINIDNGKYVQKPKKQPASKAKKTIEIVYDKRNILDLGANIRGPWECKHVELPQGPIDNYYFQNRSQYSRIADALPPLHVNSTCEISTCEFQEPCYL